MTHLHHFKAFSLTYKQDACKQRESTFSLSTEWNLKPFLNTIWG